MLMAAMIRLILLIQLDWLNLSIPEQSGHPFHLNLASDFRGNLTAV